MSAPLAYFGHHKCASTWILNILNQSCKDMGLRHKHFSNIKHLESTPDLFISSNKLDFFSYTNADYAVAKTLAFKKAFHVIRDPRDMIASAYFSHKKSHTTKHWPELIEHRNKLNDLSKDQGLLLEIEFSKRFIEEIQGWDYTSNNILHIQMEQMTQAPYETFLNIFSHLNLLIDCPLNPVQSFLLNTNHFKNRCFVKAGLYPLCTKKGKITAERLLGILHKNSYKFLAAGRKKGQEDASSHYRKGISGDWQNHFTKQHAHKFLDMYGNILIQLGYEQDNTWVETLTS